MGSLIAAVALGALVAAVAVVAQGAADRTALARHYPPASHASVTLHALALVSIGAFAVGVAVALSRLGWVVIAVPVLLGVALGPMTIVAAPAANSLINPEGSDTTALWHLVVGAAVLAILSVWTWWTARCLGPVPVERRASSFAGWPLALFVASFLVALEVHQHLPEQANAPAASAVTGWEVLAAGLVVVVAIAVAARAVAWSLLGIGASLGLIVLAYSRTGGWPGVAGWETIQPPIITCWVSTVTVLVAPIVGIFARPLRNVRAVTVQDVALR
ncbi:MAG: hypothetical protein M3O32_09005 [Actinomycetota bacterium]|nr:hypothetical protein [Actinomycetota bacterium]